MNAIYNNLNNINLLNNNSNNITLENNKQITKQSSTDTSANTANKTDSIEISEKDASKINKKKASDALKETTSEFTQKYGSDSHILLEFTVIGKMMKSDGIDVPSLNPDDNTSSTGFLSFIEKMKDYVKNNNIIHNDAPMDKSEIYEFCNMFKEKLTQYGCE